MKQNGRSFGVGPAFSEFREDDPFDVLKENNGRSEKLDSLLDVGEKVSWIFISFSTSCR
jgi:hypothetical protein